MKTKLKKKGLKLGNYNLKQEQTHEEQWEESNVMKKPRAVFGENNPKTNRNIRFEMDFR